MLFENLVFFKQENLERAGDVDAENIAEIIALFFRVKIADALLRTVTAGRVFAKADLQCAGSYFLRVRIVCQLVIAVCKIFHGKQIVARKAGAASIVSTDKIIPYIYNIIPYTMSASLLQLLLVRNIGFLCMEFVAHADILNDETRCLFYK